MGNVSFGESASSYLAGITNNASSNEIKKSNNTSSATEAQSVSKSKVTGKTIGDPRLSDKAKDYYEQLKKKYSNMDFVLVSEDQKQNAEALASKFAGGNKMLVLIDEEKIERMAEDENYRKKYESIISNAASGIKQLGSKLSSTGAGVKGYGARVNDDGTLSYFAVLEKSSATQRERIEKKAAEKKAEKKAEAKKAEKEKQKDKLEKSHKDKTSVSDDEDDDEVTISASSIEELLQKVQDYMQMDRSDNVQSESEKLIGQKFDYSV